MKSFAWPPRVSSHNGNAGRALEFVGNLCDATSAWTATRG